MLLALESDSVACAFSYGLFDRLVDIPWGPLFVLDHPFFVVARDESRIDTLLRAMVRWWPVYTSVGARYLYGLEPAPLWSVPTLLKPILLSRGVSHETLRAPLPNNDLGGWLQRYPDKFPGVLDKN